MTARTAPAPAGRSRTRPPPPASPPVPEAQGGGEARSVFYGRMARVSVRHGYYDAVGGACPDFVFRPTGYTAGLMKRLGLMFRAEETGFSVLYDERRAEELLEYVRGDHGPGKESWTRLCFTMTLRNPWFVNFTALPIDTNPSRQNIYLTNREAHEAGGDVVLPRGSRVTAAELLPVTGGQFVEEVSPQVRRVEVLDVSGEMVICKPRCVTREAARSKTPDEFGCADASDGPDDAVCSTRLHLDVTGRPEDMYQVETVWNDGSPPEVSVSQFLYTAAYPVPLGFVELLLARPRPGYPGMYPVRGLDGPSPAVHPVSYVVPFGARSTWWSYYVVDGAAAREGGKALRIRQVDRRPGEPRATFLGPCRVTLAGGRQAWRFVSRGPLPLAFRSPLNLQLVRRREDGALDTVMQRLPVAGGQQVLPLGGTQACVQARAGLADPSPDRRCRRMLDSLCKGDPPSGDPRNFSDIFVNV